MIINKLTAIQKEIQVKFDALGGVQSDKKIIAVSKTFPISDVVPLINHGHLHFGENKVQEAIEKWTNIKMHNKKLKLHMIGKLQTNKVKHAVMLFDYIHSLDNLKLATKISSEQKKLGKKINIFIQVNIGNEDQKSGITPNDISNFYNICVKNLELNIIGLMCLPPKNISSSIYFSQMKILNQKIGLHELSMGMSNDYMEALRCGATFVRIGSKIFGERD
jgi:pyridoxal phosphate enzyme (YggS family)